MATEPPVQRQSVRTQVRDILRARIASGQMDSGQIYSAVALAEELNVSATPVREAMMELASHGLVEPVYNRGFQVRTLSERELDQIVEMRIWLEPPAVAKVVKVATDAQIGALRSLAAEMVAAAAREDIEGFLVADDRFHHELLSLASNDRLVETVSRLRSQTHLRGLHRLSTRKLQSSAHEHVELLDAIERRDSRGASALMRRHLEHARGMWAGMDEQQDEQTL